MVALTWADGGALLAVLVWGANFTVNKSLLSVVDPLTVMFIRSGLTSLLLVVILAIRGQLRLPERRDVRLLVVIGLVGGTLNQVFFAFGLSHTTASHSGLIFSLTPLLVFALSYVLGHLRVQRLDLIGLSLGFGGAVLIVGAPGMSLGEAGGSTLLGDLLSVGSALTWGLWTILGTPLLRRYGPLLLTAWLTVIGVVGILPLSLPGIIAQDWGAVPTWAFAGFAYSATMGGAVSTVLWYVAVRQIGPARTAIYSNLESLFAVLFAGLLLHELVEWTALLGGAAVVGGVLLTRRGASR